MAKKGKPYKSPSPLFDTQAFRHFETVVSNEYRKVTFNKSNPRMSNDEKFPKYSKAYGSRKRADKIKRQSGQYLQSTAPVVSESLMNDTNSSFNVREQAIYIGWTAEANKVKWLREQGRFLTSHTHPINPRVIKKLMPSFNRELKRIMPKGTHTINIGKKK